MPQAPILIVDDEPHNLAALEQILSPNYALVFACSGKEAISAVSKHAPSLVLLDIEMPFMDGYTVCRQLKANPLTEGIPVIFVSHLAEVGDEAAGFDAGAVDYIVKPVSPRTALARVHTHLSLVQASSLEKSYRDAIHMLGEAGHFNDTDTGAHIWRMAAYVRVLAESYGLSNDMCRQLEMAAPMHDTGKIGIVNTILTKPGPLDASEWAVMKQHCKIGYDILIKSNAPIFRMAAEIALHHHERWDGSGYPDSLAGEAIPLSARIVALADVFDALTMKRPYKEPWPLDRVIQTVRNSAGSHFDPQLVDAFEVALPHILDIKAVWEAKERQKSA